MKPDPKKTTIAKLQQRGKKEQANLATTGQLISGYFREKEALGGEKKEQYEIVMKLGKGIPVDKLLIHKKLSAIDRLDMALAILIAIQELHRDYRLLHLDIKPANILYDPITKKATIIDVGLAMAVDEDAEIFQVKAGYKGTFGYIAPEIEEKLKKDKLNTYNEKTEVYALGMTLADIFGLEMDIINEIATRIQNDAQFKQYFKDHDNRKDLKKFILASTTTYTQKRFTLDKAISSLQKIRNDYCSSHLNIDSLIHNVAYLDVAEYLFASKEEIEEIHLALQSADAIQLISSSGKNNAYDFVKVKQALENAGHHVFEQALLNPDAQNLPIQAIIDEHTRYVEANNNIICNPFHVKLFNDDIIFRSNNEDIISLYPIEHRVQDIIINTPDIKLQASDYAAQMQNKKDRLMQVEVSAHYLPNIIGSLKERASLLKPKDAKCSLYHAEITALSKPEGKMSYGQLFERLETLEKQLKKAGQLKIQFSDIFASKTRTPIRREGSERSEDNKEKKVRFQRTKTIHGHKNITKFNQAEVNERKRSESKRSKEKEQNKPDVREEESKKTDKKHSEKRVSFKLT